MKVSLVYMAMTCMFMVGCVTMQEDLTKPMARTCELEIKNIHSQGIRMWRSKDVNGFKTVNNESEQYLEFWSMSPGYLVIRKNSNVEMIVDFRQFVQSMEEYHAFMTKYLPKELADEYAKAVVVSNKEEEFDFKTRFSMAPSWIEGKWMFRQVYEFNDPKSDVMKIPVLENGLPAVPFVLEFPDINKVGDEQRDGQWVINWAKDGNTANAVCKSWEPIGDEYFAGKRQEMMDIIESNADKVREAAAQMSRVGMSVLTEYFAAAHQEQVDLRLHMMVSGVCFAPLQQLKDMHSSGTVFTAAQRSNILGQWEERVTPGFVKAKDTYLSELRQTIDISDADFDRSYAKAQKTMCNDPFIALIESFPPEGLAH